MTVAATKKDDLTFSISEVGKFFNRSAQWIHWQESEGRFVHRDGSKIEVKREGGAPGSPGYRKFTLENIADMAEALFRHKKIREDRYKSVIARVEAFSQDLDPRTKEK